GLASQLLDELDPGDGHTALHGLHHVVDGEGRYRGGRERLHLDAGLVHGAHARFHGQLAAFEIIAEGDVDSCDAQRVTEWDQLGCALGGQDTRGARDAEDVALGRVTLPDDAKRRGLHSENGPGDRLANRLAFFRDVHHAGVALRGQVREAAVRLRPPSGRQAVTPDRACRMIASIRSLAISFSFFSSLMRHCRSAESGIVPLSASSSWSWAWCSLRRRRNSSFSAVNRSMRVSWSMRGLLGWRVRNSWVL